MIYSPSMTVSTGKRKKPTDPSQLARNAKIQEYRAKWRADKICVCCGGEPAEPGRSYGKSCLEKVAKSGSMLRRMGITESYEEILAKQGGTCIHCNQPENRTNKHGKVIKLCVEHDHALGLVPEAFRGLACETCNWIIGVIENYPDRVVAVLKSDIAKRHLPADLLKETAT
jgi:hypothetical protein